MTKKHNHGAAVAGTKSENKLSRITKELGLPFLKYKKDFKSKGLSEWGRRYHKPPKLWTQKTKTNRQRKFVSDGFIPISEDGVGIIIEQKHSDKHGTTEEKVFYDLIKIQKGVYGNEHKLWYVFTGEAAEHIEVYKEFEKEILTHELSNVKIIWGFDNYKKELLKIKGDE